MVLTYSRAYKTNAKTQRRRGKAELYAVRDVQLCNTQCTDEQGAMRNAQQICQETALLPLDGRGQGKRLDGRALTAKHGDTK